MDRAGTVRTDGPSRSRSGIILEIAATYDARRRLDKDSAAPTIGAARGLIEAENTIRDAGRTTANINAATGQSSRIARKRA